MTTTDRVNHYLQTCDMARTNQQRVAQALCMTETTLRRRLTAAGSRYEDMVKAERARRVRTMLEADPNVHANKLTEACGYSCKGVLARSLQYLVGMSLSEMRRSVA